MNYKYQKQDILGSRRYTLQHNLKDNNVSIRLFRQAHKTISVIATNNKSRKSLAFKIKRYIIDRNTQFIVHEETFVHLLTRLDSIDRLTGQITSRQGVDFTDVIWAAFTHADPKSKKRKSNC